MGDLATYAKKNGIKFFLFNFTDLFGVQRAKLVPAEAAGKMQKAGAGFAGFATWLDQTPAHPDILVMPDTNAIIPLPWRPEVAWVAGEPWMNGEPLAQAPPPGRYEELARGLSGSAATLAAFFDGPQSVMVMADDSAVRRNRLNLLGVLRNQAAVLADFEQIKG